MINFFRKIRKKLADDNKPLKYMRYAIGEIVLVVVGILIALSINNWNEDRINKIREQELVQLLYDELIENSKYINYRKKDFQGKLPFAINLINLTGDKAKSIPLDSLANYTVNIFGYSSYNPAIVHLDRIVNSEEFSLIQQDSLRALLAEYKIIINKSMLIEDELLPLHNRREFLDYQVFGYEYHKFIGKKFNAHSFEQLFDINYNIDSKDILSNPKYAALVGNYLLYYEFLLARFEDIIDAIDELQNFMEKHYDLN